MRTSGEADKSGCANHVSDIARCTFGKVNSSHAIYLVGDSTSVAYEDSFVDLPKSYPTWRVRLTGGSGCGFADVTLDEQAGNQHASGCPGRNRMIVTEIKKVRPDLLIVTNARGDANYQEHVTKELKKIEAYVSDIVVLPAPPLGLDPNECYTKVSAPVDCVSKIRGDYFTWVQAERQEADAVKGTLLDPTSWFCVNEYCPIFVKHTPIRHDKVHMTAQYASYIAPVVREALVTAKAMPAH